MNTKKQKIISKIKSISYFLLFGKTVKRAPKRKKIRAKHHINQLSTANAVARISKFLRSEIENQNRKVSGE